MIAVRVITRLLNASPPTATERVNDLDIGR
jgi:hypothetical protein